MGKIRNLTPHALHLVADGATVTVEPDPEYTPPRVSTVEEPAGSLTVDGLAVPVTQVGMGALPEGALPEPEDGVALVVSRLVADAAPHRRDLYIPHQLVRDEAGRVVGCSALGQVAPPA